MFFHTKLQLSHSKSLLKNKFLPGERFIIVNHEVSRIFDKNALNCRTSEIFVTFGYFGPYARHFSNKNWLFYFKEAFRTINVS